MRQQNYLTIRQLKGVVMHVRAVEFKRRRDNNGEIIDSAESLSPLWSTVRSYELLD
jgi:hypothetical protein